MIWKAISYNWKSTLVFLEATPKATHKFHKNRNPITKTSIRADDYRDQVLIPVVAPAFQEYMPVNNLSRMWS